MKNKSNKIAPSILAGDFGYIADEAKRIEDSGAEYLHIDVMDGHFVPNLTLGPQIVAAINRATNMFLDVHLMMYNPYDYVERFVEAGADNLTFHIEATERVEETLAYIRKCNVKAGLALCPETSAELAIPYLNQCDMILMMTVHPGFGGQKFMGEVLDKISFIREACDRLQVRAGGVVQSPSVKKVLPPFPIEVDGGIDNETAVQCAQAGATVFVAGSYLFKGGDMKKKVQELRASIS